MVYWSFTTQEQQYNNKKPLFLDLQNPLFIFLKQKSNNWTCFVWAFVNLFSHNPEAPTSVQKEMKEKCSVPRWKVKTRCLCRSFLLRHIWASCWSQFTLLEPYHMTPAIWTGEAKALHPHHVETSSVSELLTLLHVMFKQKCSTTSSLVITQLALNTKWKWVYNSL